MLDLTVVKENEGGAFALCHFRHHFIGDHCCSLNRGLTQSLTQGRVGPNLWKSACVPAIVKEPWTSIPFPNTRNLDHDQHQVRRLRTDDRNFGGWGARAGGAEQ